MNNKLLLAITASFFVFMGCGQQAEETSQEVADAEDAGDAMALPATTSSDEAMEHYTAGWDASDVGRLNDANILFFGNFAFGGAGSEILDIPLVEEAGEKPAGCAGGCSRPP